MLCTQAETQRERERGSKNNPSLDWIKCSELVLYSWLFCLKAFRGIRQSMKLNAISHIKRVVAKTWLAEAPTERYI